MEKNVTLPGTLSGCSGLLPVQPGDLDGISAAGSGNGVLPCVSEEKVSPTRARNMKDFENQITELKKENFNLKLRIYFLEERMQQEFDGPTEHIYKTNIELKVEVESLKRELHEREQLLVKASKAVASLAEGGGSELQRVKDDAQRKVQQVEDLLMKRIRLLEGDVKAAQAELEKAFAGTETEKALRLSLESKLSAMRKMHQGDLGMAVALEEKDRLIEELKLSLKSKEALIQCLEEEKSQMASDDNVSSGELRGLSATQREEKERDVEAEERGCQKERTHFEERIQALQEDLREKEREIATEKKNSLKRDKAIQGLTMALKSKEKEVEELNSEIKDLNAAFAKARVGPQKTQALKFQGSEDQEAALMEKEALLVELHSENLTKSTENQRLLRSIKKVTQEKNDLQQEKLRLERDLEEARQEGSRGARTIHDLRNEVEKLRNEVNDREKEVEKHYKGLLSQSSKKLHTQEQVISCLRESAGQKDLLVQKFSEKDLEATQQNRYLMTAEDLKFGSEGLITEKCSSQQSPGSKFIFSEEKQQSDCEVLTQALKKEQSIYAHLLKYLQHSDSVNDLKAELKDVLALRHQLEQDVLAYQNLQKALQEQLSEIRRREEEPFSFYSDQTSYLSICLEEHSQLQVEHFSQEELKKKVSELIQLVKELYTDNQHLKKSIFDLSCMSFQGNGRLESTKQTELLASKEDEDTIKIEENDENYFQSDRHLEQSNEIMEDYAKGGCKNGYLRHMDSKTLDSAGASMPGCPGEQSLEGQLVGLLSAFFLKKATPSLESRIRPDLLQALGELLLDRIHLAEQGLAGDHLNSEAEKILKQVAVQLRGELGHSFPADSFSKSHDELKSTWGTWMTKSGGDTQVELKNASVQTVTTEDDPQGFRSEGKRESWEEKPEDLCHMSGLQASFLSVNSAINKDAKKFHLPILLRTSQSLGNIYDLPASQEEVAQLQAQILELQGELKEFKTHNKELHCRLIPAEAMMKGMPVPDPALPNAQPSAGAAYQDSPGEQEGPDTTRSARRDKKADSDQYMRFELGQNSIPSALNSSWVPDSEICPTVDLAILPACNENSESFQDPASVATYLNSKSQFSVKVSAIGTDQSENIKISDDPEHLKQKIRDLQAELEGCRNFIFQLQKYAQCSEAIITVLCGTEGAQDGLNKPKGGIDEEEMTFSRLHQVHYVKHMKILRPLTPEMIDGRMLENLQQQQAEQKCELQKEQNLNLEIFSEIHNLQNKSSHLSPSRYDSLVQSQARELSFQRQQIKDSHDICVVYRQHMSTMIHAFEELLQASDVDGCVAEGFREQLSRCAGLLEQLEKLFLHGKSAGVEPSPQSELIERFRTEKDNLTYQHLQPESPEPSASHALSDDEMSEKSFLSREQKPDSETEKTSVVASHFPQDLLMEHIQEIRTLRKRLEESIKTNEKLRKQLLERQGSEADQGSTNISVYGSELHSSLMSEIHFLRKQNQALSMMIEKGSRDTQKENEKLRESLSMKAASLEHLQQEYANVKGENEQLQREVNEKERHNQQLVQEVCSSRQELSRVQEEVKSRQQLLSQNDKLLQSLRVELRVYEKLDEEHRKLQQEDRGKASGEGWKGQPSSDLHSLLIEIQALRDQLERSIQTNSTLRSKLEEQLSQGLKNPQEGALIVPVQVQSVPEWSPPLDKHDGNKCPVVSDNSFDLFESTQAVAPQSVSETPQLSRHDVDSLSCDSNSLTTSPQCMSCLVAGQHLWASKSGHHVLGLIEDYDVLCKQISQGQRLLAEMDIQTRDALSPRSEGLGTKGPHSAPLSKFLSSMNAAKLLLEEASRLLKLFWRVSVPTDDQGPLHFEQIGEMKAEITKLHKKLFEQEKNLQNTAKLLQQSKHQEKVIFDQLVITHQVLRKARGNLELRPGAAHPGTSSPSRPGS